MEIILYNEGISGELDIEVIAQYLTQKIEGVRVEVRGNPFVLNLPQGGVSDYARKIAGIKIQEIHRKILPGQEALYGEIEYEKRRILGKTRAFGVLYDGFHLQRVFSELISREEGRLGFVHIFFTNRLFGTWDDGDRRYHLRTSVYAFPSVISTTGLVQAPAKPRQYYLLKQRYEMLGRDLLGLNDRFKGSFIDYEDTRLTEVIKGYVMQAVFYSLTGNPFCEDKGCRLYNAHWQEQLIFAQLGSEYEFCQRHSKILAGLAKRQQIKERG